MAGCASCCELSDAEVRELREIFDLMDKDKGGTLSAEEVHELLQLLGMKMRLDEVVGMIADIDANSNGCVDFAEFLQVASRPQQLPHTKADLLRAFRMFADSGAPPGCITPEVLETALLQYCSELLEPTEISRLVHTLDTNAAGFVEYKDMVKRLTMSR